MTRDMRWFGYPSEAAFRAAVEAEMGEHDSHSASGDHSGATRQQQPQEFRLRGKPMSKERLKQARDYLGDDRLAHGVLLNEMTERMRRLVDSLASGRNSPGTVASELARLTVSLEPQYIPAVAEMLSNSLAEAGDWGAVDVFQESLQQQAEQRVEREQRDWVRSEEKRLGAREQMLKQEMRRAARKHSRADAEFAGEILHTIEPEELYGEDLTDDDIRTAMRSAAIANETGRQAKSTANFLEAFDAAVQSGIGAPGSSWDDAQRERWEEEQRIESANIALRKLTPPELIEARAIASVEDDRRGQGDWMDQFDKEAARMGGQTEHRERLADQAVADAHKHEEALRQMGLR